MKLSFEILSAIYCLLYVCSAADTEVKYKYKTMTEHNSFIPVSNDAYWKYAKKDEKSVLAICTDSDTHKISSKNGHFEGLPED